VRRGRARTRRTTYHLEPLSRAEVNGKRGLIFWQRNGSGKCHGTRAFTLVIFFHMRLEFCVDFVIPLLCREFAPSGEALAAIGTPPCNGVPIDLFGNNQLRHMFSISQIRRSGCAIENCAPPPHFTHAPLHTIDKAMNLNFPSMSAVGQTWVGPYPRLKVS
jgi:hypothetical protein